MGNDAQSPNGPERLGRREVLTTGLKAVYIVPAILAVVKVTERPAYAQASGGRPPREEPPRKEPPRKEPPREEPPRKQPPPEEPPRNEEPPRKEPRREPPREEPPRPKEPRREER